MMGYLQRKNDEVFAGAERASLREPDGLDFLEDKPRGRCPWDSHKLLASTSVWDGSLFCSRVNCKDYHPWDTEDENRIRYAAHRLEDAKIEERVNRELARRAE